MELEVMHVVVFEIGLTIKILSILNGNFGKNLTCPQMEPTTSTYEYVSGTYNPIGGLVGIRLEAQKVQGFVWYL